MHTGHECLLNDLFSMSPDFKPVEHLWGILQQCIRQLISAQPEIANHNKFDQSVWWHVSSSTQNVDSFASMS